MTATVDELIARHRPTLDAALGAIRSRAYYTRFPENRGKLLAVTTSPPRCLRYVHG